MRGLIIRNADSDDVKAIARLHVDSWKVAYAPILSQKHLDWVSVQREVRRKRKLLKDETPFLVAEADGNLVGFIVYSGSGESEKEALGAFEIDSFWVHHERTCQGIGAALLQEMVRRASPKQICVWVLTGVEAGPAFYEKHGFRPEEDTRKDFIFLGEPLPIVRYIKIVRTRQSEVRKKK